MKAEEAIAARADATTFSGGDVADELVEKIADDTQVPKAEARKLRWAEGIAATIRDRATATIVAAVDAEPSQPPSQAERRDAKKNSGKLLDEPPAERGAEAYRV